MMRTTVHTNHLQDARYTQKASEVQHVVFETVYLKPWSMEPVGMLVVLKVTIPRDRVENFMSLKKLPLHTKLRDFLPMWPPKLEVKNTR